MKSKLFIHLKRKEHPYSNESGANLEAWGEMEIFIRIEKDEICLFQSQWDLGLFADWFAENYEAIQNEELVIRGEKVLASESLSHTLARFSDREFINIDNDEAIEWFVSLDEYLGRHLLQRGLPGSKMPMIIIGCNKNIGEISLYWGGNDWAYQFDMHDFIETTKSEIMIFVKQWRENANEPSIHERVNNILVKLKL